MRLQLLGRVVATATAKTAKVKVDRLVRHQLYDRVCSGGGTAPRDQAVRTRVALTATSFRKSAAAPTAPTGYPQVQELPRARRKGHCLRRRHGPHRGVPARLQTQAYVAFRMPGQERRQGLTRDLAATPKDLGGIPWTGFQLLEIVKPAPKYVNPDAPAPAAVSAPSSAAAAAPPA